MFGTIIGLGFFIFLFVVSAGVGLWLDKAEKKRVEELREREPRQL